jgi:hypothetical protein
MIATTEQVPTSMAEWRVVAGRALLLTNLAFGLNRGLTDSQCAKQSETCNNNNVIIIICSTSHGGDIYLSFLQNN